jgi:hypothetical protein
MAAVGSSVTCQKSLVLISAATRIKDFVLFCRNNLEETQAKTAGALGW